MSSDGDTRPGAFMREIARQNPPKPRQEPFVRPSEGEELREFLHDTEPPSKWGFNVYRTAYDTPSAAVYPYFKAALQRKIDRGLDSLVGDDAELRRDLLGLMEWNFFDDESGHATILNNISLRDLRQYFQTWVERAPALRSRAYPESELVIDQMYPRFIFFYLVDEECLRNFAEVVGMENLASSQVGGTPRGDMSRQSEQIFIKLCEAKFEERLESMKASYESERGACRTPEEARDLEESYEGELDGNEPIDGLESRNVGWMKVSLSAFFPGIESEIGCDPSLYEERYVRPPGIYQRWR